MTTTGRSKHARVPLAALAGALVLALSGCMLVTPHEELDDPVVEGTTGIDVGAAQLRGLMIVANGVVEVAEGSFILVASNPGRHDVSVRLTWRTRTGDDSATIELPAQTSVSRGTSPGQEQLLVHDLAVVPGGLLDVQVASGSRSGRIEVPVLNGSLPYYATVTPSPKASGGAAPTPLPRD